MHALFKLLKDEHKEAKQLLSETLDNEPIDQKKLQTLCTDLSRHMDMEERYLYPVIEKKKALKEEAEEAYLEHEAARKLIKELESQKLDKVEYKVKLEMLQLDIEHHVKEEETEVFPKIEEHFSKEQLNEICEEMKSFKNQAKLSLSAK